MQIVFKGWKLYGGRVIGPHVDLGTKVEPNHQYFAQHEANKLREALAYKGRMTPQYDRA